MAKTNIQRLDSELLHCIRLGWNDMVQSMLTVDMCNAKDNWGTLLHYAAVHGNETITRYLIEMGSDVNCLGRGGRTPLMVAIIRNRVFTVKVLLEANADIHIVNADGKSALQMVLDIRYFNSEILQAFYDRLKSEIYCTDELVKRLMAADCSLYHATFLRDLELMKCMLKSGLDVDSLGPQCKTALYAAVLLNDLQLADMLVKSGADVNAVDQNGTAVLFVATSQASKDILKLLLDNGADPNVQDTETGRTPLFAIFANSTEENENTCDECVELLLRYGAVPQNSPSDPYTMLDFAMINECYNSIDLLISHLVMFEKSGKSNVESVIHCNVEEHQEALSSFANYQDKCRQILEVKIFGTVTVFDLLSQDEDVMRIYAHNHNLVPKLKFVYSEYNVMETFPYYYKILEQRVSKATGLVMLEDITIPAICDIISGNYNECYIVARKIVGYMNGHELEQLRKAGD